MFRFEHPEYLYALLLVPVVLGLYLLTQYARRNALRRFGESDLVGRLMPRASRYRHPTKLAMLLSAVALLSIGWANPQWGVRREKVKSRGVDVFVAMDISQSMLARDVRPSRLERAKKFAQNLVDGLEGNRIGLILFAGNAYLQAPITSDYTAIDLFLKSANPDMAPTQGTAITDAVDLAERSFEEGSRNHRALVIISDGENHDTEALQRTERARANGLLTFAIGVGTPEGDFIPVIVDGRADYKRSGDGSPVRSRLNEEMLQQVAEKGGGAYFNLNQSRSEQVINALAARIDAIEKRELEQRVFDEYESYFQYFIGLGLLLIVLEFLIPYRRGRFQPGETLFD